MRKNQEGRKREGEARPDEGDAGEAVELAIPEKLEKASQLKKLVLIEVPKDVGTAHQFDISYLNGAELPLISDESQEIQTEEGAQFKIDTVDEKIRKYIGKQLLPLFPVKPNGKKLVFKRSTIL
jgi:hypothetical protein